MEKQLWHKLWRNFIYQNFRSTPNCTLLSVCISLCAVQRIYTGTVHYVIAVLQVLPLAELRLGTRGVEQSVYIVTALVPFCVRKDNIETYNGNIM